MKLLTLLLTFTITVSATCPPHKSLKAGEPAPCSGHFLNQSTNEAVKKDLRDYKLTLKQLSISQGMVRDLEQDRDKWSEEAHKQAKARHSMDSDLTKGFLAGIGLTLAVMFGVGQVSR